MGGGWTRVWVCSKSPSIVSNRIPRSNPMAECHVIWLNSCECPRNAHSKVFAILFSTVLFSSPFGTNCSTCVAGKRLVHSVYSMLLYPYLCHRGTLCPATPFPSPTLRFTQVVPSSRPCNPRHCQIANGHKCAPAAVPSAEDEENLL